MNAEVAQGDSLIPDQKTLSLTQSDGSLNIIGIAWQHAVGGK